MTISWEPGEGERPGSADRTRGGTLGVRITDPGWTWAVHPEVGLLHLSDGGSTATMVTFGVSVAAGD